MKKQLFVLASFLAMIQGNFAGEKMTAFGGDVHAEDGTELNAVIYEGFDLFGQKCGAALSMIEENGEHVFAAKLFYRLHGEAFSDIELKSYRYDIATNAYNDVDGGTGSLALAGAYVRDVDMPDLNELTNYENDGSLQYMLRLNLRAQDFETFEEALHETVEDVTMFPSMKNDLNVLDSLALTLSHVGHYDRSACSNFTAIGAQSVMFELDHEDHHDDHGDHDDHEDHDEDEDDDHDQDHDH